MPIDVCISVDTEFTIAGCLVYPEARTPVGEQAVECRVDGESHGLSFMLEVLRRNELKASFFVETNHVHYFGDGPMGRIVERLLTEGHDVQLHVHPVWDAFRNPDWKRIGPERQPSDRFADRSMDQAVVLLSEGIDTLRRWGVTAPLAFRAGGMVADRMIYGAMATVGLPLASNVGLGIWRPADAHLHRRIGGLSVDGVLEVPVATYTLAGYGRRRMERCLTVAGSSLSEFKAVLTRAERAGAGPVVILTHPFELVTADSEYRRITVQPLMEKRFSKLCEYLRDNRDRFNVVTFGGRGPTWLRDGPNEECRITAPPTALLHRYVASGLVWSR